MLTSGTHLPAMQGSLGLNPLFSTPLPAFRKQITSDILGERRETKSVRTSLSSFPAGHTAVTGHSHSDSTAVLLYWRPALGEGSLVTLHRLTHQHGCFPSDGHTLSTASSALWSCPHHLLRWHPEQAAAQFAQKSVPSPRDRSAD